MHLLWKFKTVIIAYKLYQNLENENLLLEEHKGCRHVAIGTKDQLMVDKTGNRNWKRKKANLNIAWVDFRKAYDMVSHNQDFKLIDVAPNVIRLIKSFMIDWKR